MNSRQISPLFRPSTAYGVDLDGQRVILIRATRNRRHIEYKPIIADKQAIDPASIVAACLLQRESMVRWLSAPLSSTAKAEKVFPSLLDIQLPFPIETCEFSLVDMKPSADKRGTMGLVAGARHADIATRLTTLSQNGIAPRILDQEGLALWSQFLEEYPAVSSPDTVSAIVYFASDRLTLAIGRGASLLGSHTMKEADPDMVQRILKSYLQETAVSFLWFWAGPAASNIDATRKLNNLSIPFSSGPAKIVHDPDTFLARALATRALAKGSNRCNLLSGKFTHPIEKEALERIPFKAAVSFLLAGALLCVTTLTWTIAAKHRTATIQQDLRRLAIAITGSPRLVQDRQELISARRSMSAQHKIYSPFMAPFTVSLNNTLNSILKTASRNGLTFDSITMNRQTIIAHGMASKWSLCEQTAASLTSVDWTARIDKKDQVAGETRVPFVLRMTSKNEIR